MGPRTSASPASSRRWPATSRSSTCSARCFAIGAANGTISAEETAIVNEIAAELDIDAATLNAIRAEFHEQLSAVQADPPDHAATPDAAASGAAQVDSTSPSPSRRRTSASSSAS